LEYLTLAVGNAKSHPISIGGKHETAIAFLTDLEEKLDVAQVQLEIYNTLLPHVSDGAEVGQRINSLSNRLFTMSEVGFPSSPAAKSFSSLIALSRVRYVI
jgi:Non-repetitive/WGA-negative nucleoporin C-terminal.